MNTISPAASAAVTEPDRPAASARPTGFVHDTATVFVRESRPLVRDPFSVIFSLVQPLVFLGLFGPLLIGAVGRRRRRHAAVVRAGHPRDGRAVRHGLDGREPALRDADRLARAHARRAALAQRPARRAARSRRSCRSSSRARSSCSSPCRSGSRSTCRASSPASLVLAVFGVGFGALSYRLALACRNRDWMFWMVHQTLLFPLMILSGMLLPLEDGPGVDAGRRGGQPAQLPRRRRAGAARGRLRRPGRARRHRSPRSRPARSASWLGVRAMRRAA